jgi:hypothetical protein
MQIFQKVEIITEDKTEENSKRQSVNLNTEPLKYRAEKSFHDREHEFDLTLRATCDQQYRFESFYAIKRSFV